jgi:hypothetical protein
VAKEEGQPNRLAALALSSSGPAAACLLRMQVPAFQKFREAAVRRMKDSPSTVFLLEGFKCIVAAHLYNIKEDIIQCPELFHLKEVPGTLMVHRSSNDRFWVPTKGDEQHAALRFIDALIASAVKISSWQECQQTLEAIHGFAAYVVSIIPKWAAQDDEHHRFSVESMVPHYLWIYFHDVRNLRWARSNTYRHADTSPGLGARTRARQGNGWGAHERKTAIGACWALAFLWQEFLPSEAPAEHRSAARKLLRMHSWNHLDDSFGRMRPLVEGAVPPFDNWVMQVVGPASPQGIPPWQSKPASPRRVPPPWETAFENVRARVVVDGNAISGQIAFEVLGRGLLALARAEKDQVRLIWGRHPNPFGDVHTFAFFLPAITSIGNSSEYWVIHAAGGGDGAAGAMLLTMAEKFVGANASHIDLVRFDVHDEDAFEAFLRPEGITQLQRQHQDFESILTALRGNLGEMYTAAVLEHDGFKIVGRRKRLRSLGNLEVDVIGLNERTGDVILAQSKGSLHMVPSSDMEGTIGVSPSRQTAKVLDFLRVLREAKSPEICAELGAKETFRVRPLVAAFGECNWYVEEELPKHTELWTLPIILKRLRDAGFPKSQIDEIRLMSRLDSQEFPTWESLPLDMNRVGINHSR